MSDRDVRIVALPEVRALSERLAAGGTAGSAVLDARPPADFAAGRIPGAINVSIAEVRLEGRQDPRLTGLGRIYVYGEGPGSSIARAMTKKLLAAGFGGARFYSGGLSEWARFFPLEADENAAEITRPAGIE